MESEDAEPPPPPARPRRRGSPPTVEAADDGTTMPVSTDGADDARRAAAGAAAGAGAGGAGDGANDFLLLTPLTPRPRPPPRRSGQIAAAPLREKGAVGRKGEEVEVEMDPPAPPPLLPAAVIATASKASRLPPGDGGGDLGRATKSNGKKGGGRPRPEIAPAAGPGPSPSRESSPIYPDGAAAARNSFPLPIEGARGRREGGAEAEPPADDGAPGAVAVAGSAAPTPTPTPTEGGTAGAMAGGRARSGADDSGEDREGRQVAFSASVVPDAEDSDPRRGRPRPPPGIPRMREEPVYDGVPVPPRGRTKRRPSSGPAGGLSARRKWGAAIAAAGCLAAAVAIPLALRKKRAGGRDTGPRSTSPPNPEPTAAPGGSATSSERLGLLKSVLRSAGEEAGLRGTAAALEDAGSPQGMALAWLAKDDDERWSADADGDGGGKGGLVQRFALATFYFATGGEGWDERPGFLSGAHECAWNVPHPKRRGERLGASCRRDEEAVDVILLDGNSLRGALPEELALLPSLSTLDLSRNNITGSLPAAIGRLSNLARLSLKDNRLSGALPAELTGLVRLEELNLANNGLGGTLPFAAAAAPPPPPRGGLGLALGLLPNLSWLDLRWNALTGTLPPGLFASAPNLTGLGLFDNLLTGTLPADVGNLTRLEWLVLGWNHFEGAPPWETIVSNLSGRLSTLVLCKNRFDGPLPRNVGALTRLEVLWLHENRFTGTLPESVGELTALADLSLSRNKLAGTLPDVFGDMAGLFNLFLDINEFSGAIPPSLAELNYLIQFSIANTSLVGDMTFLCEASLISYGLAMADCGGVRPEVNCGCCQVCCDDHYGRPSNLTTATFGLDVLFGAGALPGCVQVAPFLWDV